MSKQQPAPQDLQGDRKSEFFHMLGEQLAAEAAGKGKRADAALAEIERRSRKKIAKRQARQQA